MEEHAEVCLAEEAERLWRSGMTVGRVSLRMGVDAAWVETVIQPHRDDEEPEPEKG